MTQKKVYVIGTFDTKAAELFYAAERVQIVGAAVCTVDVSTTPSQANVDVTPEDIARHHSRGESAVLGLDDRGLAVSAMAEALTAYVLKQNDIAGVLGVGGSGNTSLVTTAMRALPIGVPKLMVSTVASGQVAPYVGPSDIMMLHAVADIAGLNEITRTVIGNAAHAIAGMAMHDIPQQQSIKQPVGLTMFGVTTPAVTQIRAALEHNTECFVFHATGTGGQCFEKLIDTGLLKAAIDVTTTEVADFLFGGTLPCTQDRFGAIIRQKIPYVGSVGAVDMINFGPASTVPPQHRNRNLYIHNAAVTLMRTTPDENRAIGQWIAERINRMSGPTAFLLPLRGVSALDADGKPFHDSVADHVLFDAIRSSWKPAANRELIDVDAHINEPAFAAAAVNAFRHITRT